MPIPGRLPKAANSSGKGSGALSKAGRILSRRPVAGERGKGILDYCTHTGPLAIGPGRVATTRLDSLLDSLSVGIALAIALLASAEALPLRIPRGEDARRQHRHYLF